MPGLPRSLHDSGFEEIEAAVEAGGVRAVHAAALWTALYCRPSADSDPRDLPAPLERWLRTRQAAGDLTLDRPVVAESTVSGDDRTRKYLLRLSDGQQIETVIMGYPGRFTACVSTQAGCAMGCVFCATGQMGFSRHLRPGEIVMQVLHARRELALGGERLRNVVLMGMGEPLHNYDAVMKALEIVSDPHGMNIGPGHITVNTVGVAPAILRMAHERRPFNLGVSLHGSTEAERADLVPVSQRWPLAELMAACRVYSAETDRKIFFAWTLIAGINDTPGHAVRLTRLLAGLRAHVNLIRLNATPGYAGRDAADAAADVFRSTVQSAEIPCTIRQRRGIDVAAGCGQLSAARLSRPRAASARR